MRELSKGSLLEEASSRGKLEQRFGVLAFSVECVSERVEVMDTWIHSRFWQSQAACGTAGIGLAEYRQSLPRDTAGRPEWGMQRLAREVAGAGSLLALGLSRRQGGGLGISPSHVRCPGRVSCFRLVVAFHLSL